MYLTNLPYPLFAKEGKFIIKLTKDGVFTVFMYK